MAAGTNPRPRHPSRPHASVPNWPRATSRSRPISLPSGRRRSACPGTSARPARAWPSSSRSGGRKASVAPPGSCAAFQRGGGGREPRRAAPRALDEQDRADFATALDAPVGPDPDAAGALRTPAAAGGPDSAGAACAPPRPFAVFLGVPVHDVQTRSRARLNETRSGDAPMLPATASAGPVSVVSPPVPWKDIRYRPRSAANCPSRSWSFSTVGARRMKPAEVSGSAPTCSSMPVAVHSRHRPRSARESQARRVRRKLSSTDGIDVRTDRFLLRGVPGPVRSDRGSEFVAEAVRRWVSAVDVRAARCPDHAVRPHSSLGSRPQPRKRSCRLGGEAAHALTIALYQSTGSDQ